MASVTSHGTVFWGVDGGPSGYWWSQEDQMAVKDCVDVEDGETNAAKAWTLITDYTNTLRAEGFGFDELIPEDAEITGIEVNLWACYDPQFEEGGSAYCTGIWLWKDSGDYHGTLEREVQQDWGRGIFALDQWGGPADLGQAAWNRADICNEHFGLGFVVFVTPHSWVRMVFVDYIEVTVYYEPGPERMRMRHGKYFLEGALEPMETEA